MSGDDVRNHLLNTAGPIFADHGYRGATVRDICAAAGVNVAAVNYYFGDKRQLYVATVRRAHQLRAEEVPMPVWSPHMAASSKLRSFVATLMERMLGRRGAAWPTRLMLREVLNPTEACRALVEDYFRPQIDLLLSILDDMIPAGVPLSRRYQIVFSIIGQCQFYRIAGDVVPMLVGGERLDQDFQTRQLAGHIADLMCAALENIPQHWNVPATVRE